MIINYHSTFLKHYKKRIASNSSLNNRFKERVTLFTEDKDSPILRNHPLSGDLKGYYAISITGDIRLVYKYESEDAVLFYDIGIHNQVYK